MAIPIPRGPGIKMQPVPSAFDGVYDGIKQSLPLGSYAHFPDAETFRALPAFTVSLWMYPDCARAAVSKQSCRKDLSSHSVWSRTVR